jgi:hypothetical protein
MEINLSNVEELVFQDKKLQRLLPEFIHLFHQYRLAKMTPALRTMGQRTLLDFLNGLKSLHLEIIQDYFGQEITLFKTDHHIVKNLKVPLDNTIEELKGIEWLHPSLCVHRDKDYLYLSFWR